MTFRIRWLANAAKRPGPPRRRASSRINASAIIGAVVLIFGLLVALFGPALAPHGAGTIVAADPFESISAAYPLGSDYLGRDVLSRMLIGARITIGMAFFAATLASCTGTALAFAAVLGGRWADEVLGRLLDAVISIPSKICALVMVAAFGSSMSLLLLVAAFAYAPGAFRTARAWILNISAMDYVQSARARGESRIYIAWAEILPNMIHPMLTDFGLRFVFVVLLLSGLSFLGLGVQPPDADLGSLVRENISGLSEAASAVTAPAIAIAALTISVNLFLDGLPNRMNPNP